MDIRKLGAVAVLMLAACSAGEKHSAPPEVIEEESEEPEAVSITADEYDRIQPNMSYAEVVQIVGGEGTLMSEQKLSRYITRVYQYESARGNGASASLVFENDKLTSKSQLGME